MGSDGLIPPPGKGLGGPFWLLLVPHRDCQKELRTYRRALFGGGLAGAFSFPEAVPLALLARPLTKEEAARMGVLLRAATRAGGGWFRAGGNLLTAAPPPGAPRRGPLAFFGPRLEPDPARVLAESGLIRGAPVTDAPLVAALLEEGDSERIARGLPPPPPLAFRAASLACCVITPLDSGAEGLSFRWRILPGVWLPSCKKTGAPA